MLANGRWDLIRRLGTVRPIYRTDVPLPSRHPILYIFFSTNTSTEYFKHAAHSLLFLLQNAVYFIMLLLLFPVLFTFYIQGVLKFKCQIQVPKGGLNEPWECCVLYQRDIFSPQLFGYSFWTAESFLNRPCLHKAKDFTLHGSPYPDTKTYLEIQWRFIRTDFFDHHSFTRSTPFPYLTCFPHSLLLPSENQSYLISFPFTFHDKLQNRVILF